MSKVPIKKKGLDKDNLVPLMPKDQAGKRRLPKTPTFKKDPTGLQDAKLPDITEGFDPQEHETALSEEDVEQLQSVEKEEALSEKELALVNVYLAHPTLPKQEIAKLAGYASKSPKVLIGIFNRVIAKWERAGHAKEIFRKAGIGEARVALRMRELMMQNLSLPVAKDMVVHASKILDMVGADFDGDGFQIVVLRADKQAKPTETGPQRRAVREDEDKEQITK